MKLGLAVFTLFVSGVSHAAVCDVEMAKKYVAGLELVASELSNNIDMGDRVNGKTIAKADIKAIAADSAYIVTVTNEKETLYTNGNYSKYLVTLKQVGSACFPASIVLVGNTSNSSK